MADANPNNGVAPAAAVATITAAPPTDSRGSPTSVGSKASLADASHDKGGQPGRHRGFYWVDTEIGFETMELDHEDVVQSFGLPRKVLIGHIKSEIEDEAMVKSLPLALALVFFFAFMWINHDNAQYVYGVQKAIEFDIVENANFAFSAPGAMGHKGLQDVNSFADFWSWLRLGFLPLVIRQDRPVSEAPPTVSLGSLPDLDRNFYLWHNRKIGGMRLRQQVSKAVQCLSEDLGAIYGKQCFDQPAGLNLELGPERHMISTSSFEADLEKTVWMQPSNPDTGIKDVTDYALYLEKQKWLDPSTSRIELSFVTYNGHLDILVKTDVHLLFARTGHIWKDITHTSIRLNPYSDYGVYITDILFYAQITWIFFQESVEVITQIFKNRGHVRRALREYLTIWNFVDWVSVVVGYLMLGFWVQQVLMSSALKDTLLTNKNCLVEERQKLGAVCDVEQLNSFYMKMEDVRALSYINRNTAALYPAVIIFRLLKAFSAQPRLAVVTRTLSNAFVDLYHFGIAFTAIFFSYSIMGMVLFGRELREFSTIGRAMFTCFRMLMGDFDAESMLQVSVVMVWIYFGSFMVLLLLIMLNMLIAILMDVYGEVKSSVQSSETLVAQAVAIMRRTWENIKKQRVPLPQLIKALEGEDPDNLKAEEPIKVDEFMTLVNDGRLAAGTVPPMKETQAKRLMKNAAKRHAGDNVSSPQPADIMKSVAHVSKGLMNFLTVAKEEHMQNTERHLQLMEKELIQSLGMEGEPSANREGSDIRQQTLEALATSPASPSTGGDSSATDAGGMSADALAKEVPLGRLLHAAQLRLEAEVGLSGAWPMAAVSLRHVLDAARATSTELEAKPRPTPGTV